MRTRLAIITIGVALLIPAVARASLAAEQRQGQNLIAQLQSGDKTCPDLSAGDLDHIGEYVMFRALGSTARHQSMNDRMIAMLGEQGESRMHQLLGARYAGCSTTSASGGYGGMMGDGGMMSGYYNHGGLGAVMSSGNWSWMMGGTWRHMNRHDWQRLQRQLLGATTTTTARHGWSTAATMAATVGGILLVALAIAALIRRQVRRPPAASSSQ